MYIPAAAPGEGCYSQDRKDSQSWTESWNQNIPWLWLEHHLRAVGDLGGHSTWGPVLSAEHGCSYMEQSQDSLWGKQHLEPVAVSGPAEPLPASSSSPYSL